MIFVYEVTNKVFCCDSNYIVDVVVRSKFGNYSISLRSFVSFVSFVTSVL